VLPQVTDARPRKQIGRYVIKGRIGRGGMGMVYRGLDEALEREVAVKTLTAEGLLDEDSKRRFEVEAKAAAKLQHPNIVVVYERGEDRGVPFIAMELLPGTDLEALLRSGEELLLAEKLQIVIQVCRGLAYAHARSIVHRDIKPSNIRLLDDGTVKIMDFGIAKLEGTHLTRTGMVVGTVHYMSPEQVRGQKLDGRSDVFSLGVILYELLSGHRPFRGESTTQVLYKIVSETAPPLELPALGDLGPRLQAILDRALAKDRDTRFAGAEEMAAEVQAVLDRHLAASETQAVSPEALAGARRRRREGQPAEAADQLRTLVLSHPGSLVARRELRAALREQEESARPPAAAADDLPELEATYVVPPTSREPETAVAPTVTVSGSVPTSRGWRASLGAALVVGALAVVAVTSWVVLGRSVPTAPVEARLPVRSQPLGASVLVDGRDSGVRTNGAVVLPSPFPKQVELTFRKAGHRDEHRTVNLPLAPGEVVSVTLQSDVPVVPVRSTPPGARVTVDGEQVAGQTPLQLALDPSSAHVVGFALDGYQPREVEVEAGAAPAGIAADLEPLPPPGRLAVRSTYPLDVQWRGRLLARGEVSPVVSLPSGRETVILVSAALFLRAEVEVDVPAGSEAVLDAPPVGRLNVRALPDNCEVLIDGRFVDYPPILDRPIAAGRHTVRFRWPDGAARDETIEVQPARPSFVTGRKE
jgi:serine/threonine protein kinase